eukprot:639625-Prymnesium_polylepis.1
MLFGNPSHHSVCPRTVSHSPATTLSRTYVKRAVHALNILPDTQEGAVPHRDRPAHVLWSVGEHKGVCIMLVCK